MEHGATPTLSVQEARELGFRIQIWPFAGLGPALWALRAAYAGLKKKGVVEGQKISPKEIFEVCGLQEWIQVDVDAGGEDFKNGA